MVRDLEGRGYNVWLSIISTCGGMAASGLPFHAGSFFPAFPARGQDVQRGSCMTSLALLGVTDG